MQEEPEYRYAIEIFWSEEDGCFVACVPDLENCAAWGTTYEQALAQTHLAIQADLSLGECLESRSPNRRPGFCLSNRSIRTRLLSFCAPPFWPGS
jgi:predicted RNase H-like HicB family nuclease